MKLKYILPLFLLLSWSMFSQGGKEKRERIKALKVSFITTELDLTADEAARFWPIYNAYEEKQFTLRHLKMKPLIKKLEEIESLKLSDKEALNYIDQIQEIERESFNSRQKLISDLKPVLGPLKILKLKKAEEDFNRKLLAKYKGNK